MGAPDQVIRASDFETNCQILRNFGVYIVQAYEYRGEPGNGRAEYKLPFIEQVRLPFTPEEWCHLCMHEGNYYIGGCCGNSSAVQDAMNDIFREGGYVQISALAEIAELRVKHEEGERNVTPNWSDPGDHVPSTDEWQALNPWQKLAHIWHLVKDHWTPDLPEKPSKKSANNRSPINDAVTSLSNDLYRLSVCGLFVSDKDSKDGRARDNFNKLLVLYRALPALKILWEGINTLNPGPFDGFAIVYKGKMEIARNALGPCIFATHADAIKMINAWKKNQEERKDCQKTEKPIDEILEIRTINVSVENGLQFT